jgi:hypothetical protein
MYSLLLFAHSWLRWIVIVTGLFAVVRAVLGASKSRPWSGSEARPGLFFIASLDLQLLIGLALYQVFSPTVQAAFGNIGAAMKDTAYRFYVVEHSVGMIVAIALAHVGRAKSKRGPDAARYKSAAIFFTLALLIIFLSIPWPAMSGAGRPLFRFSL